MPTCAGVQHGAKVGATMSFKAHVPLSVFRGPEGKIAITLHLHGTTCTMIGIEVADLDHWLSGFKAGTGIDAADRANCRTHA